MRRILVASLFAVVACGRTGLSADDAAVVDEVAPEVEPEVAPEVALDVPADSAHDVAPETGPPPLEGPPCELPPSVEPPCKTPPCADEVLFGGMRQPSPPLRSAGPEQARLLATDGTAVYFVDAEGGYLYRFDPSTHTALPARPIGVLGTVLLGTKDRVIWQDRDDKVRMGPWNADVSTVLFDGVVTHARLGGGRLYLLGEGKLRWGTLGGPFEHVHPREVVSFATDEEYAYAVVADSITHAHLERVAPDGTTTLLGPSEYWIGAIEVVGDHLVVAGRDPSRWCKRRYGPSEVFTHIGVGRAVDRISVAGPYAYIASEYTFPNRPVWRMDLSKTVPGVDAAYVTVGDNLYDQMVLGDYVYTFRWESPIDGRLVRTLR